MLSRSRLAKFCDSIRPRISRAVMTNRLVGNDAMKALLAGISPEMIDR
jgi:hypothetical protein